MKHWHRRYSPAQAADELAQLVEAAARGLKRRKHATHLKRGQAAIAAVIKHYFRRQQAAVLAAVKPRIASELSADPPTVREASVGGKRFASNLLPSSLSPLSFAVTPDEKSDYDTAITDLITAAGKTLAKELGASASDDLLDTVASKYLHSESLQKLTGGLDDTSTQRLRTAIGDAWDAGGSYDQIVSAITETFDDFSETRAGLIAQTEAIDAYNEGRNETARGLGFDEKSWEVESDNPCEVCLGNVDDGWIDFDDSFSSGDDAPSSHPGCCCVLNFRSSESAE